MLFADLDYTIGTGAEQETTAGGQCEHIVCPDLEIPHQLPRLKIPDIDFSVHAAGEQESAIDCHGENWFSFFPTIIKFVELFNGTTVGHIKPPYFSRSVSAAGDQHFLATLFKIRTPRQ